MTEKLNQIFDFLKENQVYNENVRRLEYQKALVGSSSIQDKLFGLLYFVYGTQPFPNLDKQKQFLSAVNQMNVDSMQSFLFGLTRINSELTKTEVCKTNGEPAWVNYEILFKCMNNQKGWGEKTAALFTKVIYDIHVNQTEFSFWKDAPTFISSNDELYLPVDSVILHIFNEMDNSNQWNFGNINLELKKIGGGNDVFIWDDLWFWGFITQKGGGVNRAMTYNEEKLWSLQAISKNPNNINKIEALANEFINIIKTN